MVDLSRQRDVEIETTLWPPLSLIFRRGVYKFTSHMVNNIPFQLSILPEGLPEYRITTVYVPNHTITTITYSFTLFFYHAPGVDDG